MLRRDFYSYGDFLRAVGADDESLRQALIRGEIAAYLEPKGELARLMFNSGVGGVGPCDGENEHCSWRATTIELADIDFDQPHFFYYKLSGWYRVASASLKEAARVGAFHSPPEVVPVQSDGMLTDGDVYEFAYEVDSEYEGTRYKGIDSTYHPPLQALWFHVSDVERLTPKPAAKVDLPRDKPLDERERGSLLRIIRALDVMAKLPERGAASPVELQLQGMGFAKPSEATIRKAIDQARALEPDE